MNHLKTNLLCGALLLWGFSAMAGHLFDNSALKGIGLASCAAPFPKVFCQAETYDKKEPFETFAARFTLHYTDLEKAHALQITPELYQKVRGPYNRRNVYGAVLAYGPALPPELRTQTIRYALLAPAPIPKELGLPATAQDFRIEINSLTAGSSAKWILQPHKPKR